MKLIKEIVEEVNYLTESSEDGKKKDYFIEGIFLQAEKHNRNNRIYPLGVLQKEVARYTKEAISQKRSYGELSHSDSPSIAMERVSHYITELKQDGSNFVGKAKIMDTPNGKIVKSFMDEGLKFGVSSKGMGSLKPTSGNIQEVQDDYYLAGVDIVSDPSAPDAFVEGILEGKEWVWDNGILVEKKLEDIKKELAKPSKKKLEERALYAWKKFLKTL